MLGKRPLGGRDARAPASHSGGWLRGLALAGRGGLVLPGGTGRGHHCPRRLLLEPHLEAARASKRQRLGSAAGRLRPGQPGLVSARGAGGRGPSGGGWAEARGPTRAGALAVTASASLSRAPCRALSLNEQTTGLTCPHSAGLYAGKEKLSRSAFLCNPRPLALCSCTQHFYFTFASSNPFGANPALCHFQFGFHLFPARPGSAPKHPPLALRWPAPDSLGLAWFVSKPNYTKPGPQFCLWPSLRRPAVPPPVPGRACPALATQSSQGARLWSRDWALSSVPGKARTLGLLLLRSRRDCSEPNSPKIWYWPPAGKSFSLLIRHRGSCSAIIEALTLWTLEARGSVYFYERFSWSGTNWLG